jgi:hypothetical protein
VLTERDKMLRISELEELKKCFPPQMRVLEIGGDRSSGENAVRLGL